MGNVRFKRYKEDLAKVPKGKVPLAQAVQVIKSFKPAKFDQTVDIVLFLGIDSKQPDQAVRGAISLPHGVGSSKKVIAFCEGEDAIKAREAGAIEVGVDELMKKIQGGWMDFDVAIATPGVMKVVSKLGRVLGPQGKMPSPKAGTVVTDVATAVKEYAAGKVEFRNDDYGNVHAGVGKLSFDEKKLTENIEAFVGQIRRMKPASAKGTYIRKVSLSASMTPGVLVDIQ